MLVLAATPIGDPEDASARLRRWLRDADVLAAEDTRRLRRLCTTLGVEPRGRLVAHHDHTEARLVEELLADVRAGRDVLVVTDAGMPTVSDPGYRVVAAAAREGLAVTVVPGPSAVLAALAVSGLPTDRFCFEGFPPRRAGERAAALAGLVAEQRTMVFFEAPHRLAATLVAMAGALGADREAAVCRELTKTYEEVRRGGLGELATWAREATVLGEITVVVRGADRGPVAVTAALVDQVEGLVAAGARLREAVADVAGRAGARRNELYDAVLAARAGK
ncbi:MAG: 16S rRNA (cytidine(1402)-2'-O)-methyltransferase [Kineosporiaceae bacterium]